MDRPMRAATNVKSMVRIALALVPIPLLAGVAAAAPIRYDFGGTITRADDSPGLLGSRFSGSFTVDDAKLPTSSGPYPGDRGGGYSYYDFGTSDPARPQADGTGLEARFADGTVVRADGLNIRTSAILRPANDVVPSVDFRVSDGGPGAADGTGADYSVGLYFYGHKPLAGLNEPIPVDIGIGDFSTAVLALSGRYLPHPPGWNEGGDPILMDVPPLIAEGTIDTLTATPVPEPAWTVAALLGAAAWLARRRGR